MLCVVSIPGFGAIVVVIVLCAVVRPTRQQPPIMWKSPTETGLSLYMRFCGGVCRNGSYENDNPFHSRVPACFNCDCHWLCAIYGTCCPHIGGDSALMDVFENPGKFFPENVPSPDRYTCASFSNGQPHFYMIADCPTSVTELTQGSAKDLYTSTSTAGSMGVKSRCENSSMDTLDEVTPYQDLRYGITFKNKFCAICNGYTIEASNGQTQRKPSVAPDVTNVAASWTINVTCYHYQNVYHATSELQLLKAALEVGTDQCRVEYIQPNNRLAEAKGCDPMMKQAAKTTCTSQDSRLQNYCLNSNHKYLLVEGGHNMFCYMCTGGYLQLYFVSYVHHTSLRPPTVTYFPFSLLLGSDNLMATPMLSDTVKCDTYTQWLTEEDECQQAMCSAGKLVEPGRECRTKLSNIRGLGYKLFMVMAPKDQNIYVSPDIIKLVVNDIYSAINTISEDVQLVANITVLVKSRGKQTREVLRKVSFIAHFVSSMFPERDSVEEDIVDLASHEWMLKISKDTSIALAPSIFGTEYYALLDDVTNYTVTKSFRQMGPFRMKSRGAVTPTTPPLEAVRTLAAADQDATNSNSTLDKLYTVTIAPRRDNPNQWRFSDAFIDVSHSLTCPFIAVNYTSLKYQDGRFIFSFSVKDRTIVTSSTVKVSLINGELRICSDLYQNLTAVGGDMAAAGHVSLLDIATLYTEYVCVSLSVVCLLVTFVTYCLHPTLRTLPGLNNMCLSISLAVAQTLLLVTAQFGFPGKLNSVYCLLHAIAVHYFWLASFMWMSACCVHMYRAFTCKSAKYTQTNSNNRRFFRYCLYAFGSPVIIVLLQIIVCLGLTNGQFIGYSNKICFLDIELSLLIKVVTLMAPLGFTVITNGVLFILTVKEIIFVSSLQNRKIDGKSVITYAKLSTLTGIFYILGAVAAQLRNPVLYLLTAPTMCLQGVFIFMSFTANKRVAGLYLDLLRTVGGSSQGCNKDITTAKAGTKADEQKAALNTDSSSL